MLRLNHSGGGVNMDYRLLPFCVVLMIISNLCVLVNFENRISRIEAKQVNKYEFTTEDVNKLKLLESALKS